MATKQNWFPGVALIFVGVIFLLRQLTGFDLKNWWALFILFPAGINLYSAYQIYRSHGFSQDARAHLFWGAFLVLLASVFLAGLDFEIIWPVFLILAGVGFLSGAFGK